MTSTQYPYQVRRSKRKPTRPQAKFHLKTSYSSNQAFQMQLETVSSNQSSKDQLQFKPSYSNATGTASSAQSSEKISEGNVSLHLPV